MKKQITLLSVIAALGLIVFVASCKKDEEETKLPTCKCEAKLSQGGEYSETIDLSDNIDDLEDDYGDELADEVKDGKIKNCDQLADFIEDEYGYDVKCKAK